MSARLEQELAILSAHDRYAAAQAPLTLELQRRALAIEADLGTWEQVQAGEVTEEDLRASVVDLCQYFIDRGREMPHALMADVETCVLFLEVGR